MLRIGTIGFVIGAILGLVDAGRAAGETPDLVATAEGFEKLQIAAESAPIANLKLNSGRLECVFTSGRASFVKAGADVVGIYFDGAGTMEYVSVDPIEMPVVGYVARKSSGLKVEKSDKGVRLKDKFTRLLWLSAGAPIPELPGLAPLPLTASFQAHEAALAIGVARRARSASRCRSSTPRPRPTSGSRWRAAPIRSSTCATAWSTPPRA